MVGGTVVISAGADVATTVVGRTDRGVREPPPIEWPPPIEPLPMWPPMDVLGISRSRYRNAEHQGSDGPNNKTRTWAFHRLLTSVQSGLANDFSRALN